ncbi:MAG: aminopeptidase N, partial [Ramlibacter sp.]
LSIADVPDEFTLETVTRIVPQKNTKLEGLYATKSGFVTQCEAQGFRRITWFIDRPDNLAVYTVTVRADQKKYPVLLSNGNLVASGENWAKFEDPFPKPSYLFAVVAANLEVLEDRHKDKKLFIYVEPGKLDQAGWSMDCLKRAIIWDEKRFGLRLDLDEYKIVAVGDFNSGAMENKGLNIFNTRYVLAREDTATDADYLNIDRVVAHEYFHNWTGNRVTCRDWFQLSLKEGLTVFRDQEFSMDLAGEASARAVKRIEDVRVLRTAQFPEDAGPMAHPVRPDQYLEINNFYTVTVYEKGAEVVRMMQTLVGREGFARGMKLYFERHDGSAVTCDDFAQAIADANPDSKLAQLLPQFKRWYSQAGTPRVTASGSYDAASGIYNLTLSQSCTATPGQAEKEPFVIPVGLGLLGADGRELTNGMHVLTQASETLSFPGLQGEPVPSILRGFSAPVILEFEYTDEQLLTLLAHDSDPFNRWEAGQRLAVRRALAFIAQDGLTPGDIRLDTPYIEAMRTILRHPTLDAAFKELVLTLPAETYIAEQMDVVDPQRIHGVREAMREQLARELFADWEWAYEEHRENGAYEPDSRSSGRRALAGLALTHLCLAARQSADPVWPGKALQRFKDAGNMTDRFNALAALVTGGHELGNAALERFHAMFKDEALVLDKWFALQAGAPDRGGNILPAVRQLMKHPDFNLKNPNRARSVIFSYCSANPGAFHRSDAAGYVFWGDRVIELDGMNPQVAARLARALDRWKKLAEPMRSAAREAIARVAAKPDLSNDVREVVTRALGD